MGPPNAAAAPTAPTGADPLAASLKRGDAYWHLMRARLAAGEGRNEAVGPEIEAAIALVPDSADLRAEGAALLSAIGRRGEGERMARRALEMDPVQATALRVVAEAAALRALGPNADPQARGEAIRTYTRLLKADARVPDEIYSTLARLKLLDGDAAGGAEAAKTFLQRRPGDFGALRLAVQALAVAERPIEALETVLAWSRDYPESDEALQLAADLARQTGSWAEFEKLLVERFAERPQDARLLGLLAEARLRLGRVDEATPDLERASKAMPRDPSLRFLLAAAYAEAGRLADAADAARGLLRDYPENAGVRGLLAETLARQGEIERALESFDAAISGQGGADPSSVERRDELRRRAAALQLSRDRFDDADRRLATVENPEDPDTVELRGRVAARRGDVRETRAIARRLRAKGISGAAAMLEGEAFVAEKKPDKAVERFEEAFRTSGPVALAAGADRLQDKGFTTAAEEMLRRWVAADPHNPEARFRLGSLLERAGRKAESDVELRASLENAPDAPSVLNYLGYSLADRGIQLDEALRLIRRALELDPWNGAYLDSLGWVYFRLGRTQEAVEPLERAAREFPSDPTILDHLGEVHHKLGNRAKAVEAWRRAADAAGDNRDEVLRKLAAAESP